MKACKYSQSRSCLRVGKELKCWLGVKRRCVLLNMGIYY